MSAPCPFCVVRSSLLAMSRRPAFGRDLYPGTTGAAVAAFFLAPSDTQAAFCDRCRAIVHGVADVVVKLSTEALADGRCPDCGGAVAHGPAACPDVLEPPGGQGPPIRFDF
jgi:hypothetical protein